MSEKDLQKEKIERAGRKLLEAGRVPGAEIEKIVAAPHLFDSVKARIKAEQSQKKKAESFFPVWNFQTAAGAFAVLLVLLAFAAVIFVKTQNPPQIAGEIKKPLIEAPLVPSENPPIPEIAKTNVPPSKNELTARKADFKAETPKPVTRATKINPPKTAQTRKKEPKQVFYPLAFAGTWEADGEDLQIVRAELSRAELFALGVNLPVENESARIKTDLLVGADGVARAIRLVE
jgi:hypothetical protein